MIKTLYEEREALKQSWHWADYIDREKNRICQSHRIKRYELDAWAWDWDKSGKLSVSEILNIIDHTLNQEKNRR